MSKSALVFGASGVTGWSFVNEILSDYPQKNVWKRAHALFSRPLSLSQTQWPEDSRLNMVSGIDLLLHSQSSLEKDLVEKVPDIGEVTHVYYLAYKAGMDVQKEMDEAVDMFSKAITAVHNLCPALAVVVLQNGSKIYGCHLKAMLPWYDEASPPGTTCPPLASPPLRESNPRIPEPFASQLFYHAQIDWIKNYAKDKPWSWIETRPDVIIGFVPNQNFYSLGTTMGIYLALWRELYGEGAECAFPGTEGTWKALSNESSSDMIARQTIHLSLSPETAKGGAYNVADSKTPSNWVKKWPVLCNYFGLKPTGPTSNFPDIRTFIKKNMQTWLQMEKKYELQSGHADGGRGMQISEHLLMTKFDFDRQFDMGKMYSTGFSEERDTATTWGTVFDTMKRARIIPPVDGKAEEP